MVWYGMGSSLWYEMIWDPHYGMELYGILIIIWYDMGSSLWYSMIWDPHYGMIWDRNYGTV